MSDGDASKGAREIDGAPMGFVRGGTSTARSEKLFHDRFVDGEERRDQAARDRANARVPVEDGGAQLLTNQFTRHPEIPKAFIPLTFVDKRGETIYVNGEPVMCCADLIVGMDPMRPTALALVIVCPRCQQQSHKHQQDNQIIIKQWNKYFEFAAGKGPRTFVFEGKTFNSAGMVVQSEAFRCPDCGWRARIDQNRVWPD